MTLAQRDYFERLDVGTVAADEWCPCITCGEWVMSEFNSTESELGWEHNSCRAARLREAA